MQNQSEKTECQKRDLEEKPQQCGNNKNSMPPAKREKLKKRREALIQMLSIYTKTKRNLISNVQRSKKRFNEHMTKVKEEKIKMRRTKRKPI